MSKTWTLKDPKVMPAKDEADVQKYGTTWWSYTHDSDMPLMFNLMDGAVGDGSVITAEEWVNKESAKGTEYLRLRKVKIVSGGDSPTNSLKTPPAASEKLLELIYENTNLILERLTGVPPPTLKESWDKVSPPKDNVADVDYGPMDIGDVPFL